MADFDDDFGDIYTDVQARSSSAVNGLSDFTQFYTEPKEEEEEEDGKSSENNGGKGFASDSRKPSSVLEDLGGEVEVEECSDSDSDDDLHIVLNDGGCQGVPFPISGGGSLRLDDCDDEDDDALVPIKDSKYVWTQGSARSSNGKSNECVDLGPFGGDHLQISRARDAPNLVVTRNRYGFRIPWYRTILEMDIEPFEDKSWRYPGIDITDYFNFDLNEDSWKEYCNSLEQLRQFTSTQYGMPGSSKFCQAKEAGSEYGVFTPETMSEEMDYAGSRTYAPSSSTVSELPKGKAIQIEDSFVERQPSFDSRHPRSWNSDVVIQIAVQDPTQETYNSSAEHGQKNGRTHDTSETGEFNANGNQNNISYGTTNGDDISSGSAEADVKKVVRCSQKISASHRNKVTESLDKHNQVIDVDGNKHKEVNGISLEAIEIANKVTENLDRNTSSDDQCMMDTQLSLSDDEDQLSLISSCYESDSGTSRNSAHFDPEDIHTPVRPVENPESEPHKSITSSSKNSKGNCIKRKRDIQDYSICRRYSQKKHSYQGRRLNDLEEPTNHRNSDVSPTSDTEDPNDRNYSENFRRQERLRDSGGINREDTLDYKGRKFSYHCGIRNADNHYHKRKCFSRNDSHQLQQKLDPYVNRTSNERQTLCEDWNHSGRTQFTDERSPLTKGESRGLHSRYSSTVESRHAQWRRTRNKLLFKKIPNKWHEDDFPGEKAGRCASFISRKRNNFDEFHGRKFPLLGRELNNRGQRGGYEGSPMYLDDSQSENFKDVYCEHQENQYLSHQSYRDLYTAEDGSWNRSVSPRNYVSYPRTANERFWRQLRKIDVEEANEVNWYDDHYDSYEIEGNMHPNDHLRWRRSNWQSEVMHWTEDQFTFRHHGDKLYSEKASCSYQKYVRHENFRAKNGFSDGMPINNMQPEHINNMPINNMQPEQHRSKIPRKGTGANFVHSAKIYRGRHEQLVRCRDSMDLAVRERKILARCSKARTSMCNGRPESMGAVIGGESTTSRNLQVCETEKARAVKITQRIGWDQNSRIGPDKFPVTAQNADLDIEEGQIVTQQNAVNTPHPLQRKHYSDFNEPAHSLKKRVLDGHNANTGNKVVAEGCDKQRILQTMEKMEQRGERFKESITLRKEPDKSFTPEVDPAVETADEKQHRPARKRQWGGRFSKNDALMLGIPLKATF
ncbi:uncharacterized protein LOC126790358 [Argentina anserina]|uniref:uncharacterized protein LOC126790358 n=1 Tax=Argentina anserina TaxID=57926 RepID=UPI0021763EB7|nr:uncharacterized protein LOC126790358 [Potentilla anserina]